MSNESAFSCCLIGSDTLLSQCGEVLLSMGHQVLHVVTGSPSIANWARGHDLHVVDADDVYAEVLAAAEFDYLFAITHLAKIPDAAVASPRRLAINFHDGPLPRYGGLNTPMWAIINGEPEYAVSWHVMASGIDKGDILLQQPVAIANDDTALSLNTKCFAAALESFPLLAKQLASETAQRTAQNLDERTYYSRARRPDALGLLDWSQPANVLDRLVRGLHTGPYQNSLASPKIVLAGRGYVVDSAKVRSEESAGVPGQILEVSPHGILVRCGDGALMIDALRGFDGSEIVLSTLTDKVRIGASAVVDSTRVSEASGAIAASELYWASCLANAEAVSLPYRFNTPRVGMTTRRRRDLAVPSGMAESHVAGAFSVFLARLLGTRSVGLPLCSADWSRAAREMAPLTGEFAFARIEVNAECSVASQVELSGEAMDVALANGPWLRDLVGRTPRLRGNGLLTQENPLPVLVVFGDDELISLPDAELSLRLAGPGSAQFEYAESAYSADAADRLATQFEALLRTVRQAPAEPWKDLDLLTEEQRQTLLVEWNGTGVDRDPTVLMHTGFEQQAAASPDATAVVCGGEQISYAELDARANALAAHLQGLGAGADTLVGVHLSRSVDLMVGTLAVLKAGAAYVPLDPAFPADRVAFMIEDSSMPLLLTHSSIAADLPSTDARLIEIDGLHLPAASPRAIAGQRNLAYVIYTSGSTGRPKGVMIEHGNVANFFVAMDRVIPEAEISGRTWMAVTSLSFDISVLELFWTLNRGFKVVIFDEQRTRTVTAPVALPSKVLDMGLFMWGNDDAAGPEKYRLLLEGARFFDENGFSAVWTPERHFHAFGGPYPNPAVTGAAVAAITSNVKIRAGSCVVPLHHPVRIAEEWSVVDNISNGRVEIAAASGWNPNDFVLRPENHADNKRVMYAQLEQVRKLWRGEKVTFAGPMGDVAVESLPRPVQKELPCWITTAGNPETWREAGRLGLNVLTHLLGQSVEEINEKVLAYRQARAEAGFDPAAGRVALMLHTYVGERNDEVRELVREPMKEYLASSMRLAMDYAWTFPAFRRPGGEAVKPEDVDLKALSSEETDTILNFAFERYFETSGLFGDEETCLRMLARCAGAGVDEIACLLDFGVATGTVMDSLPRLKSVRECMVAAVAQSAAGGQTDLSFAGQVAANGVTHLQCTPSTVRMYLSDAESRAALTGIGNVMLGGEALPTSLAAELKSLLPGTLSNMYGPTETTIWSLTSRIDQLERGISIGRPIANTTVYVLDQFRKPTPPGVPGELYIGGSGVARGYLNRPELTAERFIADPFAADGSLMYATGDLVAYRDDGLLEFLGRTDFQVKVRGYRIELGEIESRVEAHRGVAEAAVIVRSAEDGDQRLVAFVAMVPGATLDFAELRAELRTALPDYMIPNEFVTVADMPRTANGKLDRKALSEIRQAPARRVENGAAPTSDVEKMLAGLWSKVLKIDAVGLHENFFDLGGHSLLVVQLHSLIKQSVERPVSLTDLYQYPTIRTLADYLAGGSDGASLKRGVSRGERRRALRQRRVS